jgi:hypothetical protein
MPKLIIPKLIIKKLKVLYVDLTDFDHVKTNG